MEGLKKKNLKGKRRYRRYRKIFTITYLFMALVFMGFAIYFFFIFNFNEYKRQHLEESLAEDFISYLVENAESIEEDITTKSESFVQSDTAPAAEEIESENEIENIEPYKEYNTEIIEGNGLIHIGNFNDDVYFERDGITYTPDYAKGELMCVFEYPAVKIKRGVYTGTWDDIYEDLDMWMVTIAHPEMELGPFMTHIAIYGHNHTSQNLSFNNLKNASIGDVFYLYSEYGIYIYEVTNVFSDWRSDTTRKYVEDFSVSSDICYIITCGRDNFLINGQSTRYKDFIVEGHLKSHKALTEYAKEVLGKN